MASRKFYYNDDNYYFDFSKFNELFINKSKKEKVKVGILEEKIANYINISKESIHNWRFKINGPGDIEIIEKLAQYFNLTNINLLLTKKKDGEKNKMLNDLQIASIKRIYDSVLDFLELFRNTNGFNDIWFDLDCKPELREDELWNIATKNFDKVVLQLKKEFLYLKNTSIYEKLEQYLYNDLYDTFDGKLSYAYRFESQVDGNPDTIEDYDKALNKLNEIIEEYV